MGGIDFFRTGSHLRKRFEFIDPGKFTRELGKSARPSGSSGSKVEDLQTVLKHKGFYSGKIDGKYDSDVVSAVKAFIEGTTAIWLWEASNSVSAVKAVIWSMFAMLL